ncbi:TFIIF-interacting CTD phosphatase, including NLI-interacting factor [Pseudoloma neurophilia]|uniref:TFIIF-interacting CTD phosphatase, including NLI-interacting factor n=1 Tax=Pseudoloma neurophilia TaxID=146866 RepID=A0A0R0LYG4_9MICR|nr:TFIIF-interacting CTD phosphatase, including NLI-interacting factor [Pseudoloma neurophilia]
MDLRLPFLSSKNEKLILVKKAVQKLENMLFLTRIKENKLPSQQKTRPVLLLKPEKLLFRRYPSLFDYKICIRPFSHLFLFNLAHHYEIISFVPGTRNEQKFIYDHLDPYGCISYRLNNEQIDLNRNYDNLIVIQTEENQWGEKFKKNLLNVQEWNGKKDEKLFLLDQFLSNLLFVDQSTWSRTIDSYKDLPFFECYNHVQKRIFHSRNFFFSNYDNFMKKVRDEKVREFEDAQIVMNEQLLKEKAMSNWITPIIGFLKTLIA